MKTEVQKQSVGDVEHLSPSPGGETDSSDPRLWQTLSLLPEPHFACSEPGTVFGWFFTCSEVKRIEFRVLLMAIGD